MSEELEQKAGDDMPAEQVAASPVDSPATEADQEAGKAFVQGARGAFLSLEQRAAPFLLRYGFTNLTHFSDAVRSDALLAGRVVDDLLNERFGEEAKAPDAV